MVMAELLPVKEIYLCDFLLFSIQGDNFERGAAP